MTIYIKNIPICPLCGSLRFKYGKRIQEFKCYACKGTFLTPLDKALPHRNGKCIHFDPGARLQSNYKVPDLPSKKEHEKPNRWYAKVNGVDKCQTIMIFENDPDPWRKLNDHW